MSQAHEEPPSFSDEFDDQFLVGAEPGNNAFFGRDVLRGLVDGIDDFIHLRESRWRQFRSVGPALLGSAMWIDDKDLIGKLGELSAASIVVTKQGRDSRKLQKLQELQEINGRLPGLPIRAFSTLGGMAPKVGGKPVVVGPSDPMDDTVLPTIRTIGYRRRAALAPIMHAKLALLGNLWWHDEGALGHVEDVLGFAPRRLWVSSANFTGASRRSLEFGYWTEDSALIEGTERFLLKVIRSSESLDPDSDSSDPELAPVEFDDEAMAEALSEMEWKDEYDET